jgi:hypothetical protein
MAFKYQRKPMRARRSAKPASAKVSAPVKAAIKQIVRGQAETKSAAFYQSANNGSSTSPATGLFQDRGWAVQNNTITNNNTDLLQLIPYISEGTADWQRIGKTIRPVSFTVKGTIRITGSLVASVASPMTNLDVYLYCLQHVQLKDYTNLRARNDFSQLLETAEGSTTRFLGNALDGMMPVADGYYQVLSRKKIQLKYGGANLPGGTLTTPVSVANAHFWSNDFTFNLSKHIPKKLVYPEDDVTLPATVYNAPTNSSPFMAIGFVDEQVGNPAGSLVRPWLEQTYIATLNYKDT